ncbi:hypothetical protein GCM10010294_37960 [Streptomyces griseoloalbus]|nr:hypothetical protein GCM10010294_37960 [Streptomyces griseoloalbus]
MGSPVAPMPARAARSVPHGAVAPADLTHRRPVSAVQPPGHRGRAGRRTRDMRAAAPDRGRAGSGTGRRPPPPGLAGSPGRPARGNTPPTGQPREPGLARPGLRAATLPASGPDEGLTHQQQKVTQLLTINYWRRT